MTRPAPGLAEAGGGGRPGPVRRGGTVVLVVGIFALALNLRAAITSLPPVFPDLAHRLHLSATAVTVLATIPVVCFGVFSGTAVPLSRRWGEERVLAGALVLLAGGLALRGAVPGTLLYPGTVLGAAAIALMNVLLPSLIKRRQPDRAGTLIGLYLLSLSVGSVLGSLVAVPGWHASAHAAWLGGQVRFSLWLWAVPAVLAFVVWLPQLRCHTRPAPAPGSNGAGERTGPPARGPRFTGPGSITRHALAWQVTVFMGLQSLTYYAALSWLPTLLQDRGVSAARAGELSALMNVGNAVTCLLVPMLAHRLRSQRMLVVPGVAATAAGIAGTLYAPLGGDWAWVLLLGLSQGATLALGVFFTVARSPDPLTAASLSGLSQAGGYLLATGGPLAVGLLHEATGSWNAPVILLVVVCAVELGAGWLAARDRVLPAS